MVSEIVILYFVFLPMTENGGLDLVKIAEVARCPAVKVKYIVCDKDGCEVGVKCV